MVFQVADAQEDGAVQDLPQMAGPLSQFGMCCAIYVLLFLCNMHTLCKALIGQMAVSESKRVLYLELETWHHSEVEGLA